MRLALLALVCSACLDPEYRECTILCDEGGGCPSGMACNDENFCTEGGATCQGGGDGDGDGDGDGVECAGNRVCVGDEVHRCDASGAVGELIDSCPTGCSEGECVDADGCAGRAEQFLYVLDNMGVLYRFDPGAGTPVFASIGTLDCDASASLLPSRPFAAPFSMSLDRSSTAWVLYDSGELFKVSTDDASCRATTFQPRQRSYDLFGMGFVADETSATGDRLWIAGSRVDPLGGDLTDHKLGHIDPDTLQVTHVVALGAVDQGPELTGTGDARLYAYFPGASDRVVEFDRTGQPGDQWPGPHQPTATSAYAFSHFGGVFYLFLTPEGAATQLIRIDPLANGGAGSVETIATTGVPHVVGAGASTCAPVSSDWSPKSWSNRSGIVDADPHDAVRSMRRAAASSAPAEMRAFVRVRTDRRRATGTQRSARRRRPR